jgi:RNA polymerase sigma-54 factor
MRLTHALEARQQQTQRIDPRQILASEILMWTAPELEAAIERELAENPALETKDGEPLSDGASAEPPALPPPTPDRLIDRIPTGGGRDEWDDDDPMDRVASSLSLRDHLRDQVGQVSNGRQQAGLVRHLIEHVDDRGYLVADLDDVAEDLRAGRAEVETAVGALQAMDPPGVGARDLHECLVLQATYLEQVGEGDRLALAVLTRCWDDLAARRDVRIAARLNAPVEAVRQSLGFIQKSLTPFPGGAFRPSWQSRANNAADTVRPDIVFRRTEAGFLVELPRDFGEALTLAPLWQRLAERPDRCSDEAMRRYVRDHVDRAEGFLQGLARRGRTLRAIAHALVEFQAGFLETGNRAFLRPLTRASLSEHLGLDESVISRAVADKFAQLPSGEVLPLDAFFGNAHAVREALARLVAEEDPANPHSDDEIAEILTLKGFPLARRTVAKYRGLEKILPARLRKRA